MSGRVRMAAGGTAIESSVSGGLLTLAGATFADATTPIVASQTVRHNGLRLVGQNSATAVLDTIAGGATWTWPVARDLMGGVLTLADLTDRAWMVTILERYVSAIPTNLSVAVGLIDNGDPKSSTGQGAALEFGWPSTDLRRVGVLTRNGAGWVRTIGAGVAGTHFGADLHGRPHTHEQISQVRVYPRDSTGQRSGVPSNNTQSSTVSYNMHQVTHFFLALFWNSNSGPASPEIVIDPCFWIGSKVLPT